jgi:hypothetical protein
VYGGPAFYLKLVAAKFLSTFIAAAGGELKYSSSEIVPSGSQRPHVKIRARGNTCNIISTVRPFKSPAVHLQAHDSDEQIYPLNSLTVALILPLASFVLIEYFAVVIAGLIQATYECNDITMKCYRLSDCFVEPLKCNAWDEQMNRTNTSELLTCVSKYPDFLVPLLALLPVLGFSVGFIYLFSCVCNQICCRELLFRFWTIALTSTTVSLGVAIVFYGIVWGFRYIFSSPKLVIFVIISLTQCGLLVASSCVLQITKRTTLSGVEKLSVQIHQSDPPQRGHYPTVRQTTNTSKLENNSLKVSIAEKGHQCKLSVMGKNAVTFSYGDQLNRNVTGNIFAFMREEEALTIALEYTIQPAQEYRLQREGIPFLLIKLGDQPGDNNTILHETPVEFRFQWSGSVLSFQGLPDHPVNLAVGCKYELHFEEEVVLECEGTQITGNHFTLERGAQKTLRMLKAELHVTDVQGSKEFTLQTNGQDSVQFEITEKELDTKTIICGQPNEFKFVCSDDNVSFENFETHALEQEEVLFETSINQKNTIGRHLMFLPGPQYTGNPRFQCKVQGNVTELITSNTQYSLDPKTPLDQGKFVLERNKKPMLHGHQFSFTHKSTTSLFAFEGTRTVSVPPGEVCTFKQHKIMFDLVTEEDGLLVKGMCFFFTHKHEGNTLQVRTEASHDYKIQGNTRYKLVQEGSTPVTFRLKVGGNESCAVSGTEFELQWAGNNNIVLKGKQTAAYQPHDTFRIRTQNTFNLECRALSNAGLAMLNAHGLLEVDGKLNNLSVKGENVDFKKVSGKCCSTTVTCTTCCAQQLPRENCTLKMKGLLELTTDGEVQKLFETGFNSTWYHY